MDGIGTNQKITRRTLALRLAAAGLAVPGFLAIGTSAVADPAVWRLSVGGGVRASLSLSILDLQRLGGETVSAVLDCARADRVPNDAWTGVPLGAVLDLARVRDGAVAVVARGRDGHGRAIQLRDVPSVDPLLAWKRNGEPLTPEQGGPVRLVVPGWAAEASVKGLAAIELVDRLPVDAVPADPTDRRLRPLREVPPRAVIVAPAEGETLRLGRQEMRGYAWSGYAPVDRVSVSVDAGATWREAEIVARAGLRGWAEFRFVWDAPPGSAVLAARATDAFGLTQPMQVPEHGRGLIHNAVRTVPVKVAR
jgi:sulfite dehydrogenase (cytochrome) subunit A